MRRRRWIVAGLGALGLAIAVQWLASLPVGPTPAASGGAATATTDTVGADGEPSDAAPRAPEVATRTAVAPAPPAAAGDGATQTIAVVHADGSPAAGAEVLFFAPRAAADRIAFDARRELTRDTEVALRELGSSTRCDADGLATVAAITHGELAARQGQLYGELDLDRDPRPRIVLRRDVALRVRVVTAANEPQRGIAVVANGQYLDRTIGGTMWPQLELGHTDDDGMASVRHLQTQMALPDEAPEWSLVVRCVGTHLDGTAHAVTAGELLAAEPLRIVVPEGGIVIATVVDADGQPCAFQPALETDTADCCCTPTTDDNRTTAVFRQVPFDRQWRLFVPVEFTNDGPKQFAELHLTGPTRAQPTVEATLVVPRVHWPLRGRLRRPDGNAADARVTMTARLVDAQGNATAVRDSGSYCTDGSFRMQMWLPQGEYLTDVVLHLEHGRPAVEVDVPVPGRFSRPTDLGEIAVPAPDGETEIAVVHAFLGDAEVTAECGMVVHFQDGPRQLLVEVDHRSRDGARVLTARVPRGGFPGPLELGCAHREAVSQCRHIELGDHVRIDLQRAASLSVRVAEGAVPEELLRGELEAVDAPIDRRFPAACSRAELQFEQMPPGSYRLRLDIDGQTVWRQELPPLRAGANTWPADGRPLDLRPRVRVLHVRVQDPAGQPVDDYALLTVPADAATLAPGAAMGARMSNWLLVQEPLPDLLVTGRRHLPQRLARPERDLALTLLPKTELRLQVVGERAQVRIAVGRSGIADPVLSAFDQQRSPPPGEEALDPAAPTSIWLPPGTDVDLRLVRDGIAGAPQRVVVGAAGPQIVVVR